MIGRPTEIPSVPACEYGPSGWCGQRGRHERCFFSSRTPETIGDYGRSDTSDHVWVCPCACHAEQGFAPCPSADHTAGAPEEPRRESAGGSPESESEPVADVVRYRPNPSVLAGNDVEALLSEAEKALLAGDEDAFIEIGNRVRDVESGSERVAVSAIEPDDFVSVTGSLERVLLVETSGLGVEIVVTGKGRLSFGRNATIRREIPGAGGPTDS